MFVFPLSWERGICTLREHAYYTKCLLQSMSVSYTVTFLLNSSKKLYIGRHLQCKELWGHPWDDHIQTLPQLDSTSPGMKVGSSMIRESQTASISLRHRLQDSLLVRPPLLMPFWCQVNEIPLLYWSEKRMVEEKCWEFWISNTLWCEWFVLVLNACGHEYLYRHKDMHGTISWALKLLVMQGHQIGVMGPNERHGIWGVVLENFLKNQRNKWL